MFDDWEFKDWIILIAIGIGIISIFIYFHLKDKNSPYCVKSISGLVATTEMWQDSTCDGDTYSAYSHYNPTTC